MKKFIAILTALFLTLNTAAFGMESDIVDIAVSTEGFSVLVAAVTEAELVDTLKSDGPFTVFAPTDEAFTNLLEALEISAEDLLAHPQLAEVLLYHVVPGKVMSTDLVDGMMAETALGESVKVDLSMGVKINDSSVVSADIEASNGVIHVIDQVLVPDSFKLMADDMMKEDTMVEETMEEDMMSDSPSIVDIALSDEQFSMLVMLLQKADLVEALQGEGPFTVFAPTNDAFVELVTALGITPDELMAQPALAEVLLYHVISGSIYSTDLSDGLMAPTLNGDTIKFDLSNGVKANSSNVVAADIQASNGVIHVVDSVLIPEGFVLEEVNMDEESVPQAGDKSTPWFLGLGLVAGALFIFGRKIR